MERFGKAIGEQLSVHALALVDAKNRPFERTPAPFTGAGAAHTRRAPRPHLASSSLKPQKNTGLHPRNPVFLLLMAEREEVQFKA